MSEEIVKIITDYGLETVGLALIINLLTGLLKMPIKALAKKTEDSTAITRFIVFMPVLLGFALTILYFKIVYGTITFNEKFYTLWLTSSSLSLTLYAIFEKLFPSKRKSVSASEVQENYELIDQIKQLLNVMGAVPESGEKNETDNAVSEEEISDACTQTPAVTDGATSAAAEEATEITTSRNRIIIGGRANEKTQSENKSV